MRLPALLLWALLSTTSALAQVSISINVPGVSIGINLPTYPQLVRVPGYPVYYAPRLRSNYFFYDGMYWVYQDDDWYASSWYNGPWGRVDAVAVPLFVLRIPVRYYRNPPLYFRTWRADTAPHWGEHWGPDWAQRRDGWDRWNRRSVPAPAPLPAYQRSYTGQRYPDVAQQPLILGRQYRYQPREAVVRQHYQEHAVQRAPVPATQRAPVPATQRAPMPPTQRSPRQDDDRTPGQRPPQAPAAVRPPPEPRPQPQAPIQAPPRPQPPAQVQPRPAQPQPQPQPQVQPAPERPARAAPGGPQRASPADRPEARPAKPEKADKPDKAEKAERGKERDKQDERAEPPPVRR